MKIRLALNFLGTLLPIVFPKQKFRLDRLVAVLLCGALSWGAVKFMDSSELEAFQETTEQLIELTQE